MTDSPVQCWLVERDIWDEDIVTLVYATPDGKRNLTRQLAANLVFRSDITAAMEVDPEDLEPTAEDDRERYRSEAQRMADTHDPDDVL